MPKPLPWDERLWLWWKTQQRAWRYGQRKHGRVGGAAYMGGRVYGRLKYKVSIAFPIRLGYHIGKTQARHRK